jgi:NACHT domain- and WD repeat-containing protein
LEAFLSAHPPTSRTFRLFVSSTFADMAAERNALARHVFPRLRDLCARGGFRFQAIDLRWGIRAEAARDHRTMRICLDEIERCRSLTPRPNFIALLGNRYGWCPLPSEIPAGHFSALLDKAPSDRERDLLRTWYTPDRNAVPERFWLRPVPPELDGWSALEAELRESIRAGIRGQPLTARERALYFGSATEQEIERACAGGVEPGQVFGFFREIPDPGAVVADASREPVRDFFDLDAAGRLDGPSWHCQEALKDTLARLCGAPFRYESRWIGLGARRTASADETCGQVVRHLAERLESLSGTLSPDGEIWHCLAQERERALERLPDALEAPRPGSPLSLRHLPALCADAFLALGRIVTEEIARAGRAAPSAIEGALHQDFGLARIASAGGVATFEGREAERRIIASYLAGPGGSALAVIGEGGAGKTSLLAQAAEEARRDLPGAEVLVRFIGATPTASEGRSLLRDVCAEIAARYPGEPVTVPDDLKGCAELFARLLQRGTAARPLVLFLDALDQLPALDEARNLRWLPAELPPSARIVVSCLRGELEPDLSRKVPPANRVALGAMTRAEGERLLETWLAAAGRTLQPAQRDRVLDGFEARGLPLYLKLAFEEARGWRSEEPPPALQPEIPDLLRDLFARLSAETHHGPTLVSHALGHLAAARYGLTEDEILDVLSADPEVFGDFLARSYHQPPEPSLPVVVWARLYADLRPYLTERNAGGVPVFTFYHRQVGETVAATYCSGAAGRARHAALARYFRRQPERLSGSGGPWLNLRKLGELPYQQTAAALWRGLARTLLDPGFLQAKAEAGLALDGLDDFARARQALAREGQGSLARQVAELLSELSRAYGQELVAFSTAPASTAAQIYGNLFAHHGEDGAIGRILSRFSRRTRYPGDGVWLRRASRAPGTSLPRELLRTLSAHAGPVTGLAVSPSGDRIASSGLDGAVRVWQTANGSLVADLRHPCPVLSVAWPSLGGGEPWLVTAGQDSCLRVWAWSEERELSCWQAHGDRIRSLASLGGGLLASGGDDRWVKVWDLGREKKEEVARFSGHDGRVLAVAGPPGRNLLLSGSEDMTIRIWDLESRRWTGTLRGHVGDVRCLAVAENGLWAASGGDDRTVRLWHLGEQRAGQVLTGHRGGVTSVAVGVLHGGDAPVAASGSEDETLGLWRAADGSRLRSFHGHTGPLGAVGIDPARGWIASAGDDGSVRFWATGTDDGDPASWQEHADLVTCLAQRSSPGGFFAVTGGRDRTARVWQGDCLEHHLTFRGHLGPVSAVLCLDDERVATGGSDGRIWVWSRLDGRRIRCLDGHTQAVTCLALPTPGRLLSAARDGTARLWDVETGDLLRICSSPLGPVEHVAALPVPGLVAGAGPTGSLFLWNQGDETLIGAWKGHDSAVTCLVVTGDGRLVSASRDHLVKVWGLDEPGREPLVLTHHREGVFSLAAAPAGGLLLSGGAEGEVAVWDLRAGPPPRVVAAHAGKVQALCLDPGLELVYSAGSDGRVVVTELAAGRVLATYQTGTPITALSVSSQDRILFGTRRGMVGLLALCGR